MTSNVAPDRFFISSFVSIPFMFSFVFILQRSYIDNYKLTLQHNKIMAETLEEQKLMLSQQQTQIVSQEKVIAIASERDRFMRDIHDGFGGILISTLRAAENDQPISHISDMIKDCLVDLENIILSLEPNEKDLTVLLGSLRQKLHKRLDKTGVNIEWRIDDLPDVDGLDASKSLSILRIVQEAITNALKHSRCTTITVTAKVLSLQGEEKISITITDNGIGFDEAAVVKTSGLKNMRYRANNSDCELSVSSSATGTAVFVGVPICIPYALPQLNR
jgi:signal transduction histidine kinase